VERAVASERGRDDRLERDYSAALAVADATCQAGGQGRPGCGSGGCGGGSRVSGQLLLSTLRPAPEQFAIGAVIVNRQGSFVQRGRPGSIVINGMLMACCLADEQWCRDASGRLAALGSLFL
jgi:hypothetical protein